MIKYYKTSGIRNDDSWLIYPIHRYNTTSDILEFYNTSTLKWESYCMVTHSPAEKFLNDYGAIEIPKSLRPDKLIEYLAVRNEEEFINRI